MKNERHLVGDIASVRAKLIETEMRIDVALNEANYLGLKSVEADLSRIRRDLKDAIRDTTTHLEMLEESK